MNVAILGASPKQERYSNKAQHALLRYGHKVYPVSPGHSTIEGLPCYKKLSDIPDPIDTITLYVGPMHIAPLIPEIIAAKPRRIIMNPGAESQDLAKAAKENGVLCEEACTLVLLSIGKF